MTGPLVLKLGGELLETVEQRTRVASAAAAMAASRPLVVVHGGGRAIDADLERRHIAPNKIDGLRMTDEATLEVVVAVLSGAANTALVAALVGQGVPAVGLTGVDAGFAPAARMSAYRATTGAVVDLGFVGDPVEADPSLITLLLGRGYVPVVASLGIDAGALSSARVLNVNADVMACRIAAALGGSDLVIAGTTAGVLDEDGESITVVDAHDVDDIISSGTATAGMVAKLTACREALRHGVGSVRIIDGRALDTDQGTDEAPGTTLVIAREDSESASAGARASESLQPIAPGVGPRRSENVGPREQQRKMTYGGLGRTGDY